MKTMQECRRRLAAVWFGGFAVLIVVLLVQTILGHYGDKADEAWGWFLPTTLPSVSLMLGVLISDATGRSGEVKVVDTFMFRLALWSSVAYLVVVSLTILLSPFASIPQLALMRLSHLWLGPLQGVVSSVIGFFFVSKDQRQPDAVPEQAHKPGAVVEQ